MAKPSERKLPLVSSRKALGLNTNIPMAEELVQLNHGSDAVKSCDQQNLTVKSCDQQNLIEQNCPKCNSSEIGLHWVDSQEVMHCICITCTYEWVE